MRIILVKSSTSSVNSAHETQFGQLAYTNTTILAQHKFSVINISSFILEEEEKGEIEFKWRLK